ncbi:basic proline-rich protein-like [Brienomyrus brachyistius]|uniref:basic proline-rich protein-like n=1 Tax=Brienomyrus brachyistius TaxID=42636 RepID=UPI0020B2CD47|nr:basic proline-rich protein-like [Brienomyrus brachyistius]XP_048852942.1 basic proline-rich protein-like [Brienomyrus brachyistius]
MSPVGTAYLGDTNEYKKGITHRIDVSLICSYSEATSASAHGSDQGPFALCVGSHSPIPQDMKQTRRRPGPQTVRGPPGRGSPRRTTAGRIAAPHPEKGRGELRREAIRQPPCRLHRRPAPPRQTRPWAQRSKGPPTPQQGPDRARRARSRQAIAAGEPAPTRAPSPGHREPPTHQWPGAPSTSRECGGGE